MKKIALFVIIILCLLPVLTQAKDDIGQQEVLTDILRTMGGDFIEEDVSANGLLVEKFLNVEELDNIGQDIIRFMGLVGEERTSDIDINNGNYYVKEVIKDEEYRQINYFGFDENKNPMTIILSSYVNMDQKGETYLYINFINKEIFVGINDIIVRIENLFKDYQKEVEITSCIIGEFNGKFNEKDINEKSIYAIHKVNGKIVDVYRDEQMVSYTAYTDYIDDSILSGEDRINLNLALRYNEFDNRTIIWIGTPIITSGY